MFVIIGSKNNNALILDTKDKVVETCSWEECNLYTSNGFNIIGFDSSFRHSLDKNGVDKYSMHYDIEHELNVGYDWDDYLNIYNGLKYSGLSYVVPADKKQYRKYKNARVSGSLTDYSFRGTVFNSDGVSFREMDSLSYLQRLLIEDILLQTIFSSTFNLNKLTKMNSSGGYLALYHTLISNTNLTVNGNEYKDNLLLFFRYIYGVINNNDLLSKKVPSFSFMGYDFFKVDLNTVMNEWEIFEYKNYIYFCDSKVCIWFSKKVLVDNAIAVNKINVGIMKSKFAGIIGQNDDVTVNPANGTIMVSNADRLEINDDFKYVLYLGGKINTIVLNTNNPQVTVKLNSKTRHNKNLIKCSNLIINVPDIVCDYALTEKLGIASNCNLSTGVENFDYYFNVNNTSIGIYFNSVLFTGVDSKGLSDLIWSKIKHYGIDEELNKGVVHYNNGIFCFNLQTYLNDEQFSSLDEDLKDFFNRINEIKNITSSVRMFAKTSNEDDKDANLLLSLSNSLRSNLGIEGAINIGGIVNLLYPDLDYSDYFTKEYACRHGIIDKVIDYMIQHYNESYNIGNKIEQECIDKLKNYYNIPDWLLVTYSNQVPEENFAYTYEFRNKLFSSDRKKNRWGDKTERVINLIDKVVMIRIFRKGYRIN